MPDKILILADKTELANSTLADIIANAKELFTKDLRAKNSISHILVLGGDGFMLHSIHKYMYLNKPFYGLNCGSLGFLLNEVKNVKDIYKKIQNAKITPIHPLKMKTTDQNGNINESLAFNDVSLLRETKQSAHIKIKIDNETKIAKLVADGIIIATPAGSTAYNFSVRGPIIPLCCDLLAMTPIAPFRPRQWRGALLPGKSKVIFEILTPNKRPVSAVADFYEYRDIRKVQIEKDQENFITLLFDHDNPLENKIIMEQFEN